MEGINRKKNSETGKCVFIVMQVNVVMRHVTLFFSDYRIVINSTFISFKYF